jgi:hypothetical protein
MGNKGAFIRLKGKELKPKYTQFDAVVIIKLIAASPKHQANGLFTRVQRNVLIHLAQICWFIIGGCVIFKSGLSLLYGEHRSSGAFRLVFRITGEPARQQGGASQAF